MLLLLKIFKFRAEQGGRITSQVWGKTKTSSIQRTSGRNSNANNFIVYVQTFFLWTFVTILIECHTFKKFDRHSSKRNNFDLVGYIFLIFLLLRITGGGGDMVNKTPRVP